MLTIMSSNGLSPLSISYLMQPSGCSSARLERLVWDHEAGSSNLPTPTISQAALFGNSRLPP